MFRSLVCVCFGKSFKVDSHSLVLGIIFIQFLDRIISNMIT